MSKITRQDVIAAYQAILGRDPEDEDVIRYQQSHESVKRLIDGLYYSRERQAKKLVDDQSPRIINACVYQRCSELSVSPPSIPVYFSEHYGQCAEDLIVTSFLRAWSVRVDSDLSKAKYIEIGGNHPIGTSATYLLSRQLGMSGVIVEANPDLIPQLKRVRKDDQVLFGAVQTEDVKTVTLTVSNLSELSSLDRSFVKNWDRGRVGEKNQVDVPALRINDIFERHLDGGVVAFMSIDIEGLDMPVLRDLNFLKYRPLIIQAEPSDQHISGNTNEMMDFLAENGYALIAQTPVNLIFVDKFEFFESPRSSNTEPFEVANDTSPRSLQASTAEAKKDATSSWPEPYLHVKGLIDTSDVVSFDFFDTIVDRLCVHPQAFDKLTQLCCFSPLGLPPDFLATRKRAEQDLRRKLGKNGDVRLGEIYSLLKHEMPEIGDKLLSAEVMEVEFNKKVLGLRPMARELLDYAASQKKRIVLVSDSYLPVDFFEGALRDLGIRAYFDFLYVSSNERKRKDTGELWYSVSKAEGIGRLKICHVGDNAISDGEIPRAMDIRTAIVADPTKEISQRFSASKEAIEAHLHAEALLGPVFMALLKEPQKASGTRCEIQSANLLGYAAYGPVLFSFMSWLLSSEAVQACPKLFFCAREGYFLRRLYEALRSRLDRFDLPPSEYLLISRRAVLSAVQSIRFEPELLIQAGDYSGAFGDFMLARTGFVVADAATSQIPIHLPADSAVVSRLIHDMELEVVAHAGQELEALQIYLKTAGFGCGSHATLVDIGYSGTIQAGLQRIIGAPAVGLYLITQPGAKRVVSGGGLAWGFLQDALYGDRPDPHIMKRSVMLEAFLTAPHGQVSHFQRTESGSVEPVFTKGGLAQQRFDVLEDVFKGVESYFSAVLDAYGAIALDLARENKSTSLEVIRLIQDGAISISKELQDALFMEDAFCGRNEVSVLRPIG